MFENHTWKHSEEGIDLRKLISTEVIIKLRQKNKEIQRELQHLRKNYFRPEEDTDNNSEEDEEDDEDVDVDRQQYKNQKNYIQEREKLEKQQEKIYKTIQECKKATFKAGVMTEARELFYDSTFRRKLGNNKKLIAFNNGIYDLKEKKFREGLPSDYMYLSLIHI